MQRLWKYISDIKGGHDIDHVRRVYKWAERLAEHEQGADYNILLPAVILHDICRQAEDDDPTGKTDHALAGAERAKKILLEESYPAEQIEKICACIATHRYSSNANPPQSLEAKILFDADKLDGLGAIGVARMFMLAGQFGERLYVPPPEHFGDDARTRYRISDLSEYSANLEFIGKMRHVPARLFLEQSKREAHRLLEPMTAFFTLLEKELSELGFFAPFKPTLPTEKEPQKHPRPTVTLYTDGACSGNPGPGGWGCILLWRDTEKEMSGNAPDTTNNRMELTAVIEGLAALREPCIVELYSDSKYVIDALDKGWARSWQKRGWIKSDKQPAQNPDLWERLLSLCDKHEVRTHWVRGHADNEYNNRCDALATGAIEKNNAV